MDINLPYLRRLRMLSIVEGISTLVLFFVAMPLKYLADMPQAVRIVGSLHGLLFVLLVVAIVIAIKKLPLRESLAVKGVVAAIIPFGPFWFERRLREIEDSAE